MQSSPQISQIHSQISKQALKKTLLVQSRLFQKLQGRLTLMKWLSIGLLSLVIVLLIAVIIAYYMIPKETELGMEELRNMGPGQIHRKTRYSGSCAKHGEQPVATLGRDGRSQTYHVG